MKINGEASILLEKHLAELGLKFEREYAFALPRKWRFDYVLKNVRIRDIDGSYRYADIAIEIDGGIWTRGRHTRGEGFQRDLEKMREAAARGWRVFRFSSGEVLDGTAKTFLQEHCL